MEQKYVDRNIALAEALESGEYKQTTGVLRDANGFCCLGVACDLYKKATKRGKWVGDSIFQLGEEVSDGMPPGKVAAWYGWDSEHPVLTVGKDTTGAAYHNDDTRRSFKQIAKGFRRVAKEFAKELAKKAA